MTQDEENVRWAYITCMISTFITPFMISSLNIAIPSIGLEFNGSQLMLNWVVTVFLLVSGSLLLPVERACNIIGRKKVLIQGLFITLISTIACSLAFSLASLIAFRVLQGIGASMIFATSVAILTSVVPPEEKGRSLGINLGVVYFGYSAAPVLGGIICEYIGWRGIFYFNAIITLIAFIIGAFKVRGELKNFDKIEMDILGSIFCVAGFIIFLYGISNLSVADYNYLIAIFGFVILTIFIRRESSILHPMLPVSVFTQNKTFLCSNLAAAINYSSIFATPFLLSLYLQSFLHIGLKLSGLVLIFQPVIMTILSPFVGRLSDRVEPRILSSLGMIVNTAGLSFFIFLGKDTSITLIALNLSFIGIGYAFFASPNNNAIMSSVDRSLYGIASSTIAMSRIFGQTVSMAIVTLITAHFLGSTTLDSQEYMPKLMTSVKSCFIVFAALNFLGIFASLARGSIRKGISSFPI
jgi:EmrB/QacA subfamily drug resistance transporter